MDLAAERPTSDALVQSAGLILAQDGVTGRLTPGESRLIADAVEQEIGLVNLDWDLRQADGALLAVFGFEGVDPRPIASNEFLVPSNGHYITQFQEPRAIHRSDRMVTGLSVGRWGEATVPLLQAMLGKEQLVFIRHLVPGSAYEPGHYPVVFAAQSGRGRAVQFTVNPRLWRQGALGHLGGLTDVFWRSIAWAARKPFVANMIPPFVTLSFDDCIGRHRFRYLDACTEHGYIPLVGIFIDRIQDRDVPLLREKANAGDILVNTHGGSTYYQKLTYDFGIEELPEDVIAERFAREDARYARWGIEPCRTFRGHFGEIGVRALPHLKARGRTYLCTPIHVGEHKADQFSQDGYWPFDSVRCFYDRLPDDHGFLIFGSFNERHLVDFLTGTTLWLHESPKNDLKRAAERGAEQIRNGLSNGFFGEILTHEQKFDALTVEEWDQILTRIDEKVARFEKISASHDQIGDYITDKSRCWISHAEMGDDGRATCRVSGHAARTLQLSVFEELDGVIERRLLAVPAFEGKSETVELT
jgi:hypothetical protein